MKTIVRYGLVLAMTGLLASTVYAKPPWAGGGEHAEKGKGHTRNGEHGARQDRDRSSQGIDVHFTARHRTVIQEYYATEFRSGHCPPGLAKKNNGCMPPGQAKKWRVGHRLPGDVRIYDLPPALVVKIGMPPAGYKYVRVASDILMIAVGTSMVVSAIEDLGRL